MLKTLRKLKISKKQQKGAREKRKEKQFVYFKDVPFLLFHQIQLIYMFP
jgi:hypothetical protein